MYLVGRRSQKLRSLPRAGVYSSRGPKIWSRTRKNKKNKRVLEIACGTGIVTRRLRELACDIEIVSTDLLNSDSSTFGGKRNFGDDENVILATSQRHRPFRFPDCSFDASDLPFVVLFVPDKRPHAMILIASFRGGLFRFNVWERWRESFWPLGTRNDACSLMRSARSVNKPGWFLRFETSSENCCKTLA